jgi:hypothetical protein
MSTFGLLFIGFGIGQDQIPTEEEFFEVIRGQGVSAPPRETRFYHRLSLNYHIN